MKNSFKPYPWNADGDVSIPGEEESSAKGSQSKPEPLMGMKFARLISDSGVCPADIALELGIPMWVAELWAGGKDTPVEKIQEYIAKWLASHSKVVGVSQSSSLKPVIPYLLSSLQGGGREHPDPDGDWSQIPHIAASKVHATKEQ